MKRQFAEVLLPATLKKSRAEFFNVMTSGRGTEALREVFTQYAEQLGQKPFPPLLEALNALFFQEAGHVVILIEYPSYATAGEPHMGAMVFGPFPGGLINADAVESVPVAYYLLVQESGGTQIVRLSDDRFVAVGPGPGGDRERFVDWVVRSFSQSGNVEDIPNHCCPR